MDGLIKNPKSQLLVFNLKVIMLVNNQLISTANAKDINADLYYKLNFSFKISWFCRVEVLNETRNKIRGFEPGLGRMFLMNFFI